MPSVRHHPGAAAATNNDGLPISTSVELLVAAVAALGALVFLVARARLFFPNKNGLLGHDYSWFFPTLLVGHFWHRQNGWLTPPDFTAAFCGGVPFLANPQSVFFSLPQLLMARLEPTPAMFVTLVVSAIVGASGCYLLLRRAFETSVSAATIGATLFLLNGFVFYRMVIGHLTYHTFAVVPLLAYVVASAQQTDSPDTRRPVLRNGLKVVWGGLLIAYLTYGGALNFQIPAVLTVACTLVMLQTAQGFRARPWLILASICLWGALLSAMKLVPAIVFAGQFHRPYLPDYLFTNPLQMLAVLGAGFFAPTALPDGVGFASGAGLGRHEFEFGLSVVPLWLVVLAIRRRRSTGLPVGHPGLWAALAGLLLIPIALTLGPRQWGVVLLQVPVLNSNTTFVRWWALFLLPIIVTAARCFDVAAETTSRRCAMLLLCTAIVVAQEARHNPGYYAEQTTVENAYDPGRITTVYRQVQRGTALPDIRRIALDTKPAIWEPDDAFIDGASAWPCYEPIFGYSLELLPQSGIVKGPVGLPAADGRLNLVDPSNYFLGRGRAAKTWRFEKSRELDARLFASYRPYVWSRPWWYRASTIITVGALTVSLALLMLYAGHVVIEVLSRTRPR